MTGYLPHRAALGRYAFESYLKARTDDTQYEPTATLITDLFADLAHYALYRGEDPADLMRIASYHFQEEARDGE